jgi:hypothetical protein
MTRPEDDNELRFTSSGDRWTIALMALFAIFVLPLFGVWAAGRPLEPYLDFPPRPRFVVHAHFSWPVFLLFAGGIVASVAPFIWRILYARSRQDQSSHGATAFGSSRVIFARTPRQGERTAVVRAHAPASQGLLLGRPLGRSSAGSRKPAVFQDTFLERQRFPWWGWAAVVWTASAWLLAWNRWDWVGEWQLHTFTPLWLGYILVMNGLTVARTGSCVMKRYPGSFLLLFPLSGAFWWTFEYLNRFVQNWYYVGGRDITAAEYAVLATIPFSTVLPAVISTADWLSSHPSASAGLDRAWAVPIAVSRQAGWIVVMGAAAGLIGIGLWPDYLFPLVWVAPLLLITGIQTARGHRSLVSAPAQGDWRLLWVMALASLMCGFFWELWNSQSFTHWEYAIPYTHRFQVFEMPLLGYAGYLPFGLECLAVVQLMISAEWVRMPAGRERLPLDPRIREQSYPCLETPY